MNTAGAGPAARGYGMTGSDTAGRLVMAGGVSAVSCLNPDGLLTMPAGCGEGEARGHPAAAAEARRQGWALIIGDGGWHVTSALPQF